MKRPETLLGAFPDTRAGRDAVHVAIAPVTAAEPLSPGDHVGLTDAGLATRSAKALIGIVDPFLVRAVAAGEICYVCLYPNTVTSLRHEWTHPAFTDTPPRPAERAVQWLRAFAEEVGLSYDTVIRAGHTCIDTGEYFVVRDSATARDAMGDPGVRAEFWLCFSAVTGREVPVTVLEECVFSCSC